MRKDTAGSDGQAISRRDIFSFVAAAAALPMTAQAVAAQTVPAPARPTALKAMAFDIQGTLFDYYCPFVRVTTNMSARKSLTLNWSGFLAEWNTGTVSIILAITAGQRPWIPAGSIFREALDSVLAARGWTSQLDTADRGELMSVWGQMTPWPDSAKGLERLKRLTTVTALSNAGMASVIATTKRGGLSFDAVLTGELVHAYKPSPEVYRAAAAFLGFAPPEIMMVAAHKFDLKAAKAAGFQTAYIPRPLEYGPETKIDLYPEAYIDMLATDLVDLSSKIAAA